MIQQYHFTRILMKLLCFRLVTFFLHVKPDLSNLVQAIVRVLQIYFKMLFILLLLVKVIKLHLYVQCFFTSYLYIYKKKLCGIWRNTVIGLAYISIPVYSSQNQTNLSNLRCIFRTLSNIYDGVFCGNSQCLKAVNFFL